MPPVECPHYQLVSSVSSLPFASPEAFSSGLHPLHSTSPAHSSSLQIACSAKKQNADSQSSCVSKFVENDRTDTNRVILQLKELLIGTWFPTNFHWQFCTQQNYPQLNRSLDQNESFWMPNEFGPQSANTECSFLKPPH